MGTDTNRQGAIGEALASAWLLMHGFIVYKNITPIGPADLIAEKEDKLYRIDVKYHNSLGPYGYTQHKPNIYTLLIKDDGLEPCFLSPDGDTIDITKI